MKNTPYQQSLTRLLAQTSTPKLGLECMHALMHQLGNPHHHFKSIHIAGTNGKGSVVAFCESILRHGGYKTGATISPHLSCARERIRINQEMISEEFFCYLEQRVHQAAEAGNLQPTFFERITAMAFLAFAEENVDYAVVEVGLGGRLDATNVLIPLICGITHIDIDHTDFLGSTLASIATEKAGIMKRGVPCFSAPQHDEVINALKDKAIAMNVPLTCIPKDFPPFVKGGQGGFNDFKQHRKKIPLSPPLLKGEKPQYQQENSHLAASIINSLNLPISQHLISTALCATRWPGRYELISHTPPILLDGAHNINGIDTLLHSMNHDDQLTAKNKVFIIGFTQGHEVNGMVNLLAKMPKSTAFIITESRSERAVKVAEIEALFTSLGINTISSSNPISALKKAQRLVKDNTILIVTGSLYIVGEIRASICNSPYDMALPRY